MRPDSLPGGATGGPPGQGFPDAPAALCGWYPRWGKRALDLSLSVPLVLLISPLMFLLAGLVRVLLGYPVIFKQERPGLRGNAFTLYKLRTMTDGRDRYGSLLPDAERLTQFGRFLRSTSLDEIPELINVIRGEMSLVGPRPLLVRYYAYFTPAERVRFLVRPGITGFSQVYGRNDLSWDLRIERDVQYVNCCSLRLDLRILLLTVWRVLSRDGLRIDPGATMLDFDEERRRSELPLKAGKR
jgi:lipopolysaccharide/colanic/teichoic acid biosynthesis glycosyltransferase